MAQRPWLYFFVLVLGANDDLSLGAAAAIPRCFRGGQGPKRSANPHSRNASTGHLTTACAALEICLESVFIGSVLRYATDLSLPLVSLVAGIDGEGLGRMVGGVT
jgi:hypothetical protein